MHSDKCIIEPPAHGNAQSACLDFAVEFLRDDGAAFRSTSTLFEQPEQLESVLCSASRSDQGQLDVSLEEAISARRALMPAGKPVDVRRDTVRKHLNVWLTKSEIILLQRQSLGDDRFLLPQLSALLAALRGTSGCVIISSKAATLCIGVHGQRQLHEHIISEGDDLDEDDDDVVLVPAAPSTICYDPTPRPLFKLRGASALRFTSVRGLQLHVLAVLSLIEKPRPETGDTVRLALLISNNRRDETRFGLIQRDVSRLRQKEKKRAITIQMAEIEALREHLRNDIHVDSRISLVRQPNSPRDRPANTHAPVADSNRTTSDKDYATLFTPYEDAPILMSTIDVKTNRLPKSISPSSLDSFDVAANSEAVPDGESSPATAPITSGLSVARSYDMGQVTASPSLAGTYSNIESIEAPAPSRISTTALKRVSSNQTVRDQPEEELLVNEYPKSDQPFLKQSSKSVPNEKNLFQAALAAYSLSLHEDYAGPDTNTAGIYDENSPDPDLSRESSNRAMRTLLSSIEGEDAERFGARVYDVMRRHTLSHRALAQMRSTSSLDVPFARDENFDASTSVSQQMPPPHPNKTDNVGKQPLHVVSSQQPRPPSKAGREPMAIGRSSRELVSEVAEQERIGYPSHELVSEVAEQDPLHNEPISTHEAPPTVAMDVGLGAECGIGVAPRASTAAEANLPQPARINSVRESDVCELAMGARLEERVILAKSKPNTPKQGKIAEAVVHTPEIAPSSGRRTSVQSTTNSTNPVDQSNMDGLEDQLTAACEVLDGRDSPLISSLERNRTEQGPRPANRADTAHESEKGEGVVLPLERKGQCVLPNETIKAHEGPPSGNGRVLEGQDNASQPSSAPPTYPSSTLSRQVLLQSSSRGFVDVQTNDEELVFFGEDSVANVSQELACDPILLAHELAVREESRARRLPEDLSPRARDSDEVLVSAAQHGLRSAVTNYDAKCTATLKQPDIDSKERKTSRPIGWAATFDMVGSGDVVATRHVPKPPHLSSNEPIALKPPRVACAEDPTLVERHEEFAELQRMQRFNERRSRKVRAMQERRRLEKEHRAALRAGAFEDVENVVTIDDFKSVSKAGTARKAPCTIPRCAPGALVQVCLAGPHCASALADALSAIERSEADNHVILLKDDAVRTFLGLFALHRGPSATNSGGPYADAERIYGRGPRRFDESVVIAFFKYNSAARSFQPLPSKSFTFTTDAAIIKKNIYFRAKQITTC